VTRRERSAALPLAVAALAGIAVLGVAGLALARPGGGGSYSGGGGRGGGGGGGYGGGGGGGGGGDAGDLVGAIAWFVFSDLPWPLKVGIVGVIVVLFVVGRLRRRRTEEWSSGGWDGPPRTSDPMPAWVPSPAPARTLGQRRRLEDIARYDPDFSVVLFEDFLFALYAHVHYALAGGRVDRLSAYLSPAVAAQLRSVHVAEVHTVLVGALRFTDVRGTDQGGPGPIAVEVEIESNVASVAAPGQPERTSYLREHWTLTRRREARSRPPALARVLACPACGAPQEAVVAGTCTHCRRVVSNGDFDWVVADARVVASEERGPMLTAEVAERGGDLPTIVDPEAQARLQAITRRDPFVQWPALQARVGLVFSEFQIAWAQRDLLKMRPYFSDALFDVQRYWVEAYKAQGLRNVTERARVVGLELARVTSDKWFDAVTVRLSATSLDYTLRDADQKVVCGSKSRERAYTEYWTFVRGAARRGPTRTTPECPNCGAPLAVGMAGDCRYCRVKVTTGEFDWVLSRIEQDEAYEG
jgi:predicted lipid-binding transport protein (Tim44 family)